MQVLFEKTWNETLSEQQKQAFIQQYNIDQQINGGLSASPILIKQKRSGGLVATVFLQNNSDEAVSVETTTVELHDENGDTAASETFALSLKIPPFTATPWSFVFSSDHVRTSVAPTDLWTVEIE